MNMNEQVLKMVFIFVYLIVAFSCAAAYADNYIYTILFVFIITNALLRPYQILMGRFG